MDNGERGRRLMAMASEYLQDHRANRQLKLAMGFAVEPMERNNPTLAFIAPQTPVAERLQRHGDRRMMRGSHGTHSART